jgi:hypothetical protein
VKLAQLLEFVLPSKAMPLKFTWKVGRGKRDLEAEPLRVGWVGRKTTLKMGWGIEMKKAKPLGRVGMGRQTMGVGWWEARDKLC